MIFSEPLPYSEAVQSRAVRELLPTDFRTRLLQEIPAQLRERAFFSAGVTNAEFLQRASDKIDQLLDGKADRATMRLELKQLLDTLGYQPVEGEEGTLTDLSSDDRLNLILDTNLEMAQGYGHWAQGQDPEILDQWPAQELIRVVDSKVKRNWPQRWSEAMDALGNQTTAMFWGDRMVALKNDPIWVQISRFGLPYAPFDFNSGMDVQDVDRDEAIEMGLIDRDTQIAPQTRGFNDGLESALDVSSSIAEAVQTLFGGRTRLVDGVLRWIGGGA